MNEIISTEITYDSESGFGVEMHAAGLYHSKRTTAGPLVPLIPSDLKKRAEDGSTDKDRNYEIGIDCGFIRSRSSHYSR